MDAERMDERFAPFSIKLTFKTKEEVDNMFNIINHSYIIDACENADFDNLRCVLDTDSDETNFARFSLALEQRYIAKEELLKHHNVK